MHHCCWLWLCQRESLLKKFSLEEFRNILKNFLRKNVFSLALNAVSHKLKNISRAISHSVQYSETTLPQQEIKAVMINTSEVSEKQILMKNKNLILSLFKVVTIFLEVISETIVNCQSFSFRKKSLKRVFIFKIELVKLVFLGSCTP